MLAHTYTASTRAMSRRKKHGKHPKYPKDQGSDSNSELFISAVNRALTNLDLAHKNIGNRVLVMTMVKCTVLYEMHWGMKRLVAVDRGTVQVPWEGNLFCVRFRNYLCSSACTW